MTAVSQEQGEWLSISQAAAVACVSRREMSNSCICNRVVWRTVDNVRQVFIPSSGSAFIRPKQTRYINAGKQARQPVLHFESCSRIPVPVIDPAVYNVPVVGPMVGWGEMLHPFGMRTSCPPGDDNAGICRGIDYAYACYCNGIPVWRAVFAEYTGMTRADNDRLLEIVKSQYEVDTQLWRMQAGEFDPVKADRLLRNKLPIGERERRRYLRVVMEMKKEGVK